VTSPARRSRGASRHRYRAHVLVVLAVVSGLVGAVKLASLWGLRKAKAGRPVLVLVALLLVPICYSWGSDAFGWPTPGSFARNSGLLGAPVDVVVFVGAGTVTAGITLAVLVTSGVVCRLERWSGAAD
jgi:hypothetical protein